MKIRTLLAIIIAVLAIFLVGLFLYERPAKQEASHAPVQTESATVLFACDAGKTITAKFVTDANPPASKAGEMPQPTGKVTLAASDGRTLTLNQTVSGSGIRYANVDESIIFWSKGNTAFMTEGNSETYRGCVSVAEDPGGLPKMYASSTLGFSLRYPSGYKANEAYVYDAMGPGKEIAGVKFVIDPAIATGTNLSNDTYVSVEELPNAESCSAGLFLDGETNVKSLTQNGIQFNVASTMGAAAGNRYEETVYAIPGTNPCIAVRYFVHYGAIENYPEGAVKEFDKAKLLEQFDAIRNTLTLGR